MNPTKPALAPIARCLMPCFEAVSSVESLALPHPRLAASDRSLRCFQGSMESLSSSKFHDRIITHGAEKGGKKFLRFQIALSACASFVADEWSTNHSSCGRHRKDSMKVHVVLALLLVGAAGEVIIGIISPIKAIRRPTLALASSLVEMK